MRRGFGFHDRHSPFRFDPATLFIGGAIKGAFYDPSNITTLFQDDAGTTPVTAVEQTVGRILDLSGNGSHATQSVAASRPTYRARYNLLTKTEDFSDSAWTKTTATIAANAGTAPDNTNTATLIYPTTTGSNRGAYATLSALPANTYIATIYAKASGLQSIRIVEFLGSSIAGIINLQTGAVSNILAGYTVTTTDAGNGWWLISVTGTVTTGTRYFQFVITDNAGSSTATTSGTNGVLIWHPDVRVTNYGANIPAYQRVNTATDYDTVGFPPYLALDGSNDSLLTGSIDFTGTDKMTVWAGVTKLSDAAQGVVAELSATIASNNGAFLLSAPNSAAANYNWSSKGTTQVDNTVTTYAAPNTAVLTGQANIAGPSNIIRVNGAQAGSVATTQGTGNFGNYPLYIGRRNNATLPFNGRLYGLIVLGAAASDWQVQVTEQWMAGKTGVQF